MSRKLSAAAAQKVAAEQMLQAAKQCHFWSRSLERNDADMAAVIDLNRSLYAVRSAFLKDEAGELLLLDLGQGKYRLAPDGRDTLLQVVHVVVDGDNAAESNKNQQHNDKRGTLKPIPESEISAYTQELCVDFLLRKKLRRKLLSRIARRLNRLATAMDGDVAPPGPPKYGDLRLHCDEAAVAAFAELKQRQDQAWNRIQAVREDEYLKGLKRHNVESSKSSPREKSKEEHHGNDTTLETKKSVDEIKAEEAEKEPALVVPASTTPPPDATPSSSPIKSADGTDMLTDEEESHDPLAADYTLLKDYKDAYEKVLDSLAVDVVATATVPKYSILQTVREEDYVAIKSGGGIGATHQSMTAKEKEMEFKRWQSSLLARIPEQPTYAELGLEHRVFFADERRKRALQTIEQAKKQAERGDDDDDSSEESDNDDASAESPVKKSKPSDDERGSDDEMKVVDQNEVETSLASESGEDEAEEKDTDPETSNETEAKEKDTHLEKSNETEVKEKDTDLEKSNEPEAMAVEENSPADNVVSDTKPAADTKLSASSDADVSEQVKPVEHPDEHGEGTGTSGVGQAVDPVLSDKDDWVVVDEADAVEDEAVATIADNDTDTGKSEGVDLSEDATKAKEEKADSEDDEKDGSKELGTKAKDEKKDGVESSGDEDKISSKAKEETAGEAEKKNEPEEKKVGIEESPAPKILKPISLAAVPSFYEQDMKRIKLVHADLMSSSMREHAMRRLEEGTREYNQALKNSSELAEHRMYLQNRINALAHDLRNQEHNFKTEYSTQVAIAKQRWNASRLQFENSKLNQMLPSRNGRNPTGTHMTQNYKTRLDGMGISELVGDCLADIVDCVEGISRGMIRNDHFSEPFVLPPPPADVDSFQRSKQLEATKRNEMNAITLRLRTSEGDRLRAWKKMLKTKVEFDIPHHHYSSNGSVRIIQLDSNTCATMPLPALHQSATQRVPLELVAGRSFVASYTPSHVVRAMPTDLHLDSKYSTARVRDRIASDGTVAPVTKPKLTKEGLYQRPAGRTRKGMEWDSVRGIWIPAPEP